jgi:hypothetical protein
MYAAEGLCLPASARAMESRTVCTCRWPQHWPANTLPLLMGNGDTPHGQPAGTYTGRHNRFLADNAVLPHKQPIGLDRGLYNVLRQLYASELPCLDIRLASTSLATKGASSYQVQPTRRFVEGRPASALARCTTRILDRETNLTPLLSGSLAPHEAPPK